MRDSFATAVPFDQDVAPLPPAVRKRIGNIVAQGGKIHEVVEQDPDTFLIVSTVPSYGHDRVRT